MDTAVIDRLKDLDRGKLVKDLAEQLPEIRESFRLSCDDLERATGIGAKRIVAFEEGRQVPKWSEYLSIVFVLWANEHSRAVLDEKGLFPVELRKAFSMNRNAHEPTI